MRVAAMRCAPPRNSLSENRWWENWKGCPIFFPMSAARETDYVLGTHDDEVARLGLQHRVWRSVVTDCWMRVGITHGWRVIDVGSGPGYATADLAEIVGPTGTVL